MWKAHDPHVKNFMFAQGCGEMLLVFTRCQHGNIPSDFCGQFSESAGKQQLPTPAS